MRSSKRQADEICSLVVEHGILEKSLISPSAALAAMNNKKKYVMEKSQKIAALSIWKAQEIIRSFAIGCTHMVVSWNDQTHGQCRGHNCMTTSFLSTQVSFYLLKYHCQEVDMALFHERMLSSNPVLGVTQTKSSAK